MSASQLADQDSATVRLARLPVALFVAGAIILIAWFGLKTWRLARVAQSMLAYESRARALLDEGLLSADPERAEALVMDLRRDVVILNREIKPFLPLLTRMGFVPRVGPLLAQSADYLEMADAGSEAAAYAVRGLKPALYVLQDEQATGSDLLSGVLPIIEDARPDLFAASAALERFIAARSRIDVGDSFPARLRGLLSQVDGKLYLADQLKLLTAFPQIMGHGGGRTYMLLVQNEDELRPTGGFLSGVGFLTVADGKIISLSFDDANLVDDWQNKPYDMPPDPFYDLMGSELFLFRDVNFWPDFPTSAEKAIELYAYGQDSAPQLDGVIAFDKEFVAMLVGVTGPIEVPELETTLRRDNVVDRLREAWTTGSDEQPLGEWFRQRKEFLEPVARALRTALFNNMHQLDPLYLSETLHQAVQQKHLQVYLRDPQSALILDQIDWDGRLELPSSQDYVFVVDTNVGFNKVNPLIERTIDYDVQLLEDGTARATLTLRYAHQGHSTAAPCTHYQNYEQGITYDELINRCYWNYLRIYLPPGLDPLQLPRHDLPAGAEPAGQHWPAQTAQLRQDADGTTYVENAFVLVQGKTLTSTYVYDIPLLVGDTSQRRYRLKILKQAGTDPAPVSVHITVPEGYVVHETSPAASINGREVVLQTDLLTDLDLEVSYRPVLAE